MVGRHKRSLVRSVLSIGANQCVCAKRAVHLPRVPSTTDFGGSASIPVCSEIGTCMRPSDRWLQGNRALAGHACQVLARRRQDRLLGIGA